MHYVAVLGGCLPKYELDNDLGKCHDDQTNNRVDERILSGADFTRITTGGDVAKAANNYHDNGNNTDDCRKDINNLLKQVIKVSGGSAIITVSTPRG